MSSNENDPITGQFAGDRDGLIAVAEVISHDEFYPLAQHAATRVEILNRHLGGTQILLADPGCGSGHRAGCSDSNLSLSHRSVQPRNQSNYNQSLAEHGLIFHHSERKRETKISGTAFDWQG